MRFTKLQVVLLMISLVALACYFIYRKESYAYFFASTFFIVFCWVELIILLRLKEQNQRYDISFIKFLGLLLTGLLILWKKDWELISLTSLPFLLYFGARFYESFILKQKDSHVSNTSDKS